MKLFFLGIFFFISVRPVAQMVATTVQPKSSTTPPPITFRIILTANGTFGYDIFNGDRRIIHQTSKPCLRGNQGFRRKKYAEKVAELVIEKLNRHIVPPSVTIHEMDSLKINY